MLIIPNYQIIQQIYESANSKVYRALRDEDNQPIILKVLEDYPSPEELRCYRQEYDITHRLADLEGVVKAYSLEKHHNTLVMCLEDFGGESLKIWQEQRVFTLDELLTFAISATEILGQIHGQNIIHKDINPSNIILNPNTKVLKIIDFGISTQFSKQHMTLKNPEVLEGTLAYMSPEQTGRMNRVLDYRTDFYSLGATFYKLFTGIVPFDTTDAMELVHCHIAKQPVPPCKLRNFSKNGVSGQEMVSNIIMKLLEKTADARYQSAWGIKADLQTCQVAMQKTGTVETFTLAQKDISDRFQIPQKLYGREHEIDTLRSAFERVVSGKAEIMLVAGYCGIGKSVLVKEIYKSLTEKKGYFITGKFDQFQRNIPYSAIVNAFKELVQQLLTESETQLTQWKERINTALGPNGQVIIDILPEIELIIGKQPAVPQLGPSESQNRFNLVFQNFMHVFCQPEHPLVVFLDDLQWVDSATLKLLERVMTDRDNTSFFFIGAYRDNEVDLTHPLMMTIDKICRDAMHCVSTEPNISTINQINLKPLAFEHINQLIAESLHQNLKAVGALTDLVMRKTGGNPFFVNQFLHTLYQEDLLHFVPPTFEQKGHWQWDIEQIETVNITDNVVELMISKLKKLPSSARQVLRLAACVGNRFDLDTLSVIYEKSATDTFADLMPVLTEGLILPQSELEMSSSDIHSSQFIIHHLQFLHDRVQQAAYALIDDEQKQAVHLSTGRLLLANIPTEKRAEKLFEIVDHLNRGQKLITDHQEKMVLAELNLMAGKKAKDATAYAAAREYFNAGLNWLTNENWTSHYQLTFALHKEMGEVEYLNSHFKQSETLICLTIEKAISAIEKAELYILLIGQYQLLGKYQEAIETGKKALMLLDIDLPDSNFPEAMQIEMAKINQQLEGKTIASLIHEPEMTDPKIIIAAKLLTKLFPSTFFANLELHNFISSKLINLYFKYGHTPDTAQGYVVYGLLLGPILGDYLQAYEFGILGIKIIDKFPKSALKCRSYHVFSMFLNHWVKPLKQSIPISEEAYKAALETGELDTAGYTLMAQSISVFSQGKHLLKMLTAISQFVQFAHKTQHQFVVDCLLAFQLTTLNLAGKTKTHLDFHNDELNEAQYLENCQNNKSLGGICFHHILKSMTLYLYGEFAQAYQHALAVEKLSDIASGMFIITEHNFYSSLILVALCRNNPTDTQKREKLTANQEQMKLWATNCPENFRHKYLLVKAEMARIEGKALEEVMDLYDQSIAKARENEFIHNEALANELAAKFWLEKGKEEFAQLYLTKAHYCYQQWGALAIVTNLEKRYPQFLSSKIARAIPTDVTILATRMFSTFSTTGSSEWLDLNSIMKAAQTLSGEIVLGKLLEKMMHIVIENAGAEKGFLLLPKQNNWFIEAQGLMDSSDTTVLQSLPLEDSEQVSANIIHYVARTFDNVVLHDATQNGSFTRDAYIVKHRPKSVLCMPLVNQGQLSGILYLENNLTTEAFASERIKTLNLLSSQIAISIENSLLYNNLEQKVAERTYELQIAKETAEEANKAIMESIQYAKLIQSSLLPNLDQVKTYLPNSFFLWKPRDVVGGDMLYAESVAEGFIVAVIDCTGHGVPGAFMTMIASSNLKRIIREESCHNPAEILKRLNFSVKTSLQQDTEYALSDDGLDAAICFVKPHEKCLIFAGAKMPLYHIHNDKLRVIKGDKQSLGYKKSDLNFTFTNHTVKIEEGMSCYLSTDGFLDQLGGPKRFPFGNKRFKKLLLENCHAAFDKQFEQLLEAFNEYKGDNERQDDVTVVGFGFVGGNPLWLPLQL